MPSDEAFVDSNGVAVAVIRVQRAWRAWRARRVFEERRRTWAVCRQLRLERIRIQEEEEYLQLVEADESCDLGLPSRGNIASSSSSTVVSSLRGAGQRSSPQTSTCMHTDAKGIADSLRRTFMENESTQRTTIERCEEHHRSRLATLSSRQYRGFCEEENPSPPVFQTNKQRRMQEQARRSVQLDSLAEALSKGLLYQEWGLRSELEQIEIQEFLALRQDWDAYRPLQEQLAVSCSGGWVSPVRHYPPQHWSASEAAIVLQRAFRRYRSRRRLGSRSSCFVAEEVALVANEERLLRAQVLHAAATEWSALLAQFQAFSSALRPSRQHRRSSLSSAPISSWSDLPSLSLVRGPGVRQLLRKRSLGGSSFCLHKWREGMLMAGQLVGCRDDLRSPSDQGGESLVTSGSPSGEEGPGRKATGKGQRQGSAGSSALLPSSRAQRQRIGSLSLDPELVVARFSPPAPLFVGDEEEVPSCSLPTGEISPPQTPYSEPRSELSSLNGSPQVSPREGRSLTPPSPPSLLLPHRLSSSGCTFPLMMPSPKFSLSSQTKPGAWPQPQQQQLWKQEELLAQPPKQKSLAYGPPVGVVSPTSTATTGGPSSLLVRKLFRRSAIPRQRGVLVHPLPALPSPSVSNCKPKLEPLPPLLATSSTLGGGGGEGKLKVASISSSSSTFGGSGGFPRKPSAPPSSIPRHHAPLLSPLHPSTEATYTPLQRW